MKNKVFLLILLLSIINIHCYQTITLFMKPYPIITDEKSAIEKSKKITQLPKISKYVFRAFAKPFLTSGIFCTYGGSSAITDLNGQVTFIRTFIRPHKEPSIDLIITKNIVPILSLENTVHHWELSRKRDVKIFSVERKEDPIARAYFWDAKEKPLPKDNIVPIEAIVIFANPKYVYVPTGITMTTPNSQLVLPDIYVKPGINKVKSALLFFNVKNLASPEIALYKKAKTHYSRNLKN